MLNLLQWNPKIWDDVKLPPGVDLQLTVDTIAMEYGTCDVIHHYPDTFKWMNDAWFRRKYWSIEEMFKTLAYEYDAIENYRRYEDGWKTNDDNETRSRNAVRDMTSDLDRNVADNVTESDTRNVDTTENRIADTETRTDAEADVSAYNSESYVNDNKATSNSTGKETVNGTTLVEDTDERKIEKAEAENQKRTDNENQQENETIQNDRDEKYGLLAHGNIGVTTTQEMIRQQREIVSFDFYRWLADMWAKDMVVMCSC